MAGERILVVDDGADMREFVTNYVLKPNGFDYLEARDGLEAFDKIIAEEPSLVLLDLQMPRLDGVGLLKKLKEENISIPVVLMTFYGSEEIAIEVFRLGVKDYVIKPFTDDELLEAIERALVETRLRRERDSLQEKLVLANRDLQTRNRSYQAVFKVGQLAAKSPALDPIITHAIQTASQLAESSGAGLLVYNQASGTFERRARTGPEGGVHIVSEPITSDLALRAFAEGRAVLGNPQLDMVTQEFHVSVYVPIASAGQRFGALEVSAPAGQVSEHQLDLLEMLAGFIAIGFERQG